MASKKKKVKSDREIELNRKIQELQKKKRTISRQLDDLDTEIIGYKEEIYKIQYENPR